MKLKDLNDKQKLAVIIGIAVLVLGGAIFIMFQTQLKSIKIIKNQTSSLETKIIQVKRAQDDIDKFEGELKSIQETLEEVSEKLPSEKELPELLSKLAELASTFPTKDYVSVTPGNVADMGKYYKLPLSINIRCTYLNLQTYLQKLEGLPRLIKLETIQIDPDGTNPTILTVRLDMNVYYLKTKS